MSNPLDNAVKIERLKAALKTLIDATEALERELEVISLEPEEEYEQARENLDQAQDAARKTLQSIK